MHVRGNNRQVIFRDDDDRRIYLAMLRAVVREFNWRLLAFCLMDNHVHLLIETPDANLGAGMHRLHSRYVRRFHDRHTTSGRLFGDRYGAVPVKSDEQLCVVATYIALNPVKARLCPQPQDWPWSSHAAVTGLRPRPNWLDVNRLLGFFEIFGGNGRDCYIRKVTAERETLNHPKGAWPL